MKIRVLVVVAGLLIAGAGSALGVPLDSLKLEFENGQVYVLHQVEAQETLYGLSKRYFTSVEAIKSQNNITDNSLSLGSILKIPWERSMVHRVQPGETLYTIARKYGVKVRQIKQWNDLSDHKLTINQVLSLGKPPEELAPPPQLKADQHVVASSETLYGIAKKYQLSVEQLTEWNQLEGIGLSIGDTLWLSEPPASLSADDSSGPPVGEKSTPPDDDREEMLTEEPSPVSATPVKAVKEKGIAAVFEEDDTKKYLALHRSAPVGTIMQVRNEMTNLSVFVRVVGKLPDTGNNNNVLLRLSKSAQQGLGALDNKFRVELSYIPNR